MTFVILETMCEIEESLGLAYPASLNCFCMDRYKIFYNSKKYSVNNNFEIVSQFMNFFISSPGCNYKFFIISNNFKTNILKYSLIF